MQRLEQNNHQNLLEWLNNVIMQAEALYTGDHDAYMALVDAEQYCFRRMQRYMQLFKHHGLEWPEEDKVNYRRLLEQKEQVEKAATETVNDLRREVLKSSVVRDLNDRFGHRL